MLPGIQSSNLTGFSKKKKTPQNSHFENKHCPFLSSLKEYGQPTESLSGHLEDNWGMNALKMPCTNRNRPLSTGKQMPTGCSVMDS